MVARLYLCIFSHVLLLYLLYILALCLLCCIVIVCPSLRESKLLKHSNCVLPPFISRVHVSVGHVISTQKALAKLIQTDYLIIFLESLLCS